MKEWDAQAYHRLSNPQFAWGLRVLDRLSLEGDEAVIDAGCGSGRLTAELLDRLPRGRVLAIDNSENMVREAQARLGPRFGDRVSCEVGDLTTVTVAEPADAIFSTATFHWIHDHARLFENLFRALVPGGRLVAQCGGAGNLDLLHERAAVVMHTAPFAEHYGGWQEPWYFAGAEVTAKRLEAAGFEEIVTDLVPQPTPFDDATTFAQFLETVVLRVHLARLPTAELRAELVARVTAEAARDTPPHALDYVRLNIAARRPA